MENNDNVFTNFTEGATLIFKKWSGFRLTLDHNPDILDEYVEEEEDEMQDDESPEELEINFLLKALWEDIYLELSKGQIEKFIAKMLYDFLSENFDTYLEDESESLVARSLTRLYTELKENKSEYLNRLREIDKTFNYSAYSIKFPIEIVETDTQDLQTGVEKMKIEPDEEGFVEVKKGKKKF
jgi:hypothetical protein